MYTNLYNLRKPAENTYPMWPFFMHLMSIHTFQILWHVSYMQAYLDWSSNWFLPNQLISDATSQPALIIQPHISKILSDRH